MSLLKSGAYPQLKAVCTDLISSKAASEQEVRGVLDSAGLIYGESAQVRVDAVWADFNKRALARLEKARDRPSLVWSPGGKSTAYEASQILMERWEGRAEPLPLRPFSQLSLVNFRQPASLPDHLVVCAVLGARASAGDLCGVAQAWSCLDKQHHRIGLESLLQSVVFGGFYNAINAFVVVHRLGVSPDAIDYEAEDGQAEERPADVVARGTDLMSHIYTKQLPRLMEHIGSQHSDVLTLIVEWVYGQVLARSSPGVSARVRELWARAMARARAMLCYAMICYAMLCYATLRYAMLCYAMLCYLSLACLAGTVSIPQLHSHILGALNCGASVAEVRYILDQTGLLWGQSSQTLVDSFWIDLERDLLQKSKHK
eukprot:g32235.t1